MQSYNKQIDRQTARDPSMQEDFLNTKVYKILVRLQIKWFRFEMILSSLS